MTDRVDVAVVGGGITGLATAWWLRKRGFEVLVLDQAEEPGGTMRTVSDAGWLIETGPNSALETTPLFQVLFEDLGLSGEVVYGNASANKRFILRDGRLHVLPMSAPAFLGSKLWSTAGKVRLLLEPFIGRASSEETIAQFVRRRLGREFLDYAINPFVAGVYAGDPEQLSVQAAFPKLHALEREYGSLIVGQIRGARKRARRAEQSKDRARLFSFRGGMQTLPKSLADKLGTAYRGNAKVESVQAYGQGYMLDLGDGRGRIMARCVVTAAPTRQTGRLLQDLEPSIAPLLESIPYPPVAEVFLGFHRDAVSHPLDGFGFLVPTVERRRILGTLWSSTLFPGRAPEGHVALTTFVGGSRQPLLAGLPDDQLLDAVIGDLSAVLGISADPVYRRIIRWDRAIPQYGLGHLSIVDRVRAVEGRLPGLFVSGNFIGGISVGDCVMQSERTADRVEQIMNQHSPSGHH
ncbi:MAG: protoporphyrinogen oxidase [Bacteroidota bacterium]